LKICSTSGKPALTFYSVETRLNSPARTVVHFKPETGRTHQLRIHAQAIGHSILGCDLYGDDNSYGLANRLMLHAQSLEFLHPVTEENMHAICPCPF
jgi:tRNA pseudouridine32 synthase/23S rRNA pseudouridine746 synthase